MKTNTIEGVEKRNAIPDNIKKGWDKKLRNIFLILPLSMLMIYAFFILTDPGGYFDFILNVFLRGIFPGIIFTVFFIFYHWRYLNQMKEGTLRPNRMDISGWIIMAFLLFVGIYPIVTGKALPSPFVIAFDGLLTSGLLYSVTIYPLTLYWEKKNGLIIYLVEDKPSKWRPVALPDKGA